MTRKVNLVKHLSLEELEDRYKKERDGRVKERVLAILLLYDGKEEKEVAKTLQRCINTVRNWIVAWNKNGYEGLKPHFTEGAKLKLTGGVWDKIVKEIEEKDMNLKPVAVYLNTPSGIKHLYTGVWKVRRKKMRAPHKKSLPKKEEEPTDAVFKKS